MIFVPPMTDIRAYAEMIRDISGNDPVKRDKTLRGYYQRDRLYDATHQ